MPPTSAKRPAARPAPRYAQVAADLRGGIVTGSYASGTSLPTEGALCASYGISRFTVREALRVLQGEGLIRRQRGSGTIVVGTTPALRQSLSDVAELLNYAAGSTFTFTAHGQVALSTARAAALGLPEASRWVHVTGLRTIDGLAAPIAATEVFINVELERFVGALRAGHDTLFAQLAQLGAFRIARVEQDIEAIGAGVRDAALLGIARRTPCLRIRRSYQDERGRIVLVSSSTHPGERFTYSMHIDN